MQTFVVYCKVIRIPPRDVYQKSHQNLIRSLENMSLTSIRCLQQGGTLSIVKAKDMSELWKELQKHPLLYYAEWRIEELTLTVETQPTNDLWNFIEKHPLQIFFERNIKFSDTDPVETSHKLTRVPLC